MPAALWEWLCASSGGRSWAMQQRYTGARQGLIGERRQTVKQRRALTPTIAARG